LLALSQQQPRRCTQFWSSAKQVWEQVCWAPTTHMSSRTLQSLERNGAHTQSGIYLAVRVLFVWYAGILEASRAVDPQTHSLQCLLP
jgi:hypothetical protein